ncbi:MAG: hypothetical protein ACW981_05710 [Candidatus Hodarchaeales archaeon]|jgi:hypothetical protein
MNKLQLIKLLGLCTFFLLNNFIISGTATKVDVINNSFEDWSYSDLNNWDLINEIGKIPNCSKSTDSISDEFSLRCDFDKENELGLGESISIIQNISGIENNTSYNISFWFKTDFINNSYPLSLGVAWKWIDSAGNFIEHPEGLGFQLSRHMKVYQKIDKWSQFSPQYYPKFMENLSGFSNSTTALSPNGTTGMQLSIYAGFSPNKPNYNTYILFDDVELENIRGTNTSGTTTTTASGFLIVTFGVIGVISIKRKI